MKNFKSLLVTATLLALPIYGWAVEKTIYIAEDGRSWHFAGRTTVGEETFVPEGQDPQNWEEAIILHHLPVNDIPLGIYYETFMEMLNKKAGNIFQSKLLYGDDSELLFEWWIDPSEKEPQHGWIKITASDKGLNFFRYTTKKVDEVGAISDRWGKIMSEYELAVLPKRVRVEVDFSLDDREWTVAESSEKNQKFVLKGESLDEWSERFSIDLFSANGETPYSFYYKTLEGVEEEAGGDLETKILNADEESITFQWEVAREGVRELSFYKMTLLNNNLASGILYTLKIGEGSDGKREKLWEKIVAGSRVEMNYDYALHPKSEGGEK